MSDPLLERSVRAFLEAVASDEEPVPAGACTAALTGAASAALVVLLCRIMHKRREPPAVQEHLGNAQRLQRTLEELIEADAQAYQDYMAARRLPSSAEREAALAAATRTPLDIASACFEVEGIARAIVSLATGAIVSDTRVAQRLADAAARAALDTAAENVDSLSDSAHKRSLQDELNKLREL